jgi:hypothetical protein
MENASIKAIKQFIVLLLIYVAINGILWVGQELYYYANTKKINEIETVLKNEKQAINTIESNLLSSEAKLNQKESQLNIYKSLGDIEKYNNGVDEYNNLLQNYQSVLENYKIKLTSYNLKIDEVNALIKNSGTRWYLIPIPLPGKDYNPRI